MKYFIHDSLFAQNISKWIQSKCYVWNAGSAPTARNVPLSRMRSALTIINQEASLSHFTWRVQLQSSLEG